MAASTVIVILNKRTEWEPLQFGSSREHSIRDECNSSLITSVVREPKPSRGLIARWIFFDVRHSAAFCINYSHF